MSANRQILTISCDDRPGLVASVTRILADNNGNIDKSQQFNDLAAGRFFMRVVFSVASESDVGNLQAAFGAFSGADNFTWTLRAAGERRKVMLMVSKFDHCLGDLLYRQRIGELPMDVVGIVCNHPREALKITLVGDLPFHYLPVTKDTKPQQEAQIKADGRRESGAELVVLARYMQILSDDMARFLSGRCINIHHSFLPGFKGAKPYHQAHARGVKMIGATGALRHRRPRRRPDHLSGCRGDQPCRHARRSGAQGPRHRTPRAGARGAIITWKTACCSTATRPSFSATDRACQSLAAASTSAAASSCGQDRNGE